MDSSLSKELTKVLRKGVKVNTSHKVTTIEEMEMM